MPRSGEHARKVQTEKTGGGIWRTNLQEKKSAVACNSLDLQPWCVARIKNETVRSSKASRQTNKKSLNKAKRLHSL